MKTLVCALAFAVSGLGHLVAADPLTPVKDLVLTGTFTTAPANPKKGFTPVPITKATLLEAFGPGGVKVSDTGYVFGEGGKIVLANKHDFTVYVSLFTNVSNGGAPVTVTAKNNQKMRLLQDVTIFNNPFSNSASTTITVGHLTPTRGTLKGKGQFVTGGPFPAGANTNAVISGTFSVSLIGPLQPQP